MQKTIIRNGRVINRDTDTVQDILIDASGRIAKIAHSISVDGEYHEINAEGLLVFPGVIDDQVHFREPGLTHKADIHTESRAAVAGGTTSFMEMPNTNPPIFTNALLETKYEKAAQVSPANYSFFLGASHDNIDELLRMDASKNCGVKIFMGSSTGNLLVEDEVVLDKIFSQVSHLIATHCEDEATINENLAIYQERYGEEIPFSAHPEIRSHLGCLLSSQKAIRIAKKHDTRLHILHISTADEVELFEKLPLAEKRITSEACVHHLWFNDTFYKDKGSLVKCNPAIKSEEDRRAVWQGLKNGNIDIIATDHAPHTWDEKQNKYLSAPSGLPLVQHSLQMMCEKVKDGEISYNWLVNKMSHAPAECFKIKDRGYIEEGMFADIVLVDPQQKYTINKSNILYKCGWSPLEGESFSHSIHTTLVNGKIVFAENKVIDIPAGERLSFNA